MGALVEAAKAITTELNAATWSLEFEAVRSYADFDMVLDDNDDSLHVDVVGVAIDSVELADRDHVEMSLPIDIGIRKRLSADPALGRIPTDLVDPLADLLEEIAKHFSKFEVPAGGSTWTGTNIRASHDREVLKQSGLYVGIVQLELENYSTI